MSVFLQCFRSFTSQLSCLVLFAYLDNITCLVLLALSSVACLIYLVFVFPVLIYLSCLVLYCLTCFVWFLLCLNQTCDLHKSSIVSNKNCLMSMDCLVPLVPLVPVFLTPAALHSIIHHVVVWHVWRLYSLTYIYISPFKFNWHSTSG